MKGSSPATNAPLASSCWPIMNSGSTMPSSCMVCSHSMVATPCSEVSWGTGPSKGVPNELSHRNMRSALVPPVP
jgi:hypothetical protein